MVSNNISSIKTIDELQKYVYATLCSDHELLTDAFPTSETAIRKNNGDVLTDVREGDMFLLTPSDAHCFIGETAAEYSHRDVIIRKNVLLTEDLYAAGSFFAADGKAAWKRI